MARASTTCTNPLASKGKHVHGTEETPLLVKHNHDLEKGSADDAVVRGQDVSETEAIGYFMLVLAAVFFCLMTLFTRYVAAYRSLSVPAMVFARGVAQGLVTLAAIAAFMDFRTVFAVPRKYLPHVIVRGIIGGSNVVLMHYAFSVVPLGITTCILFFHPILTLMLSSLILGEEIGKLDVFAAALSFTGVVLVSNPSLSLNITSIHVTSGYISGVISCSVAACLLAVAVIIVRSVGRGVNFMCMVFAYSFFVAVGGVLLGGVNFEEFRRDPAGFGIVLLAAVCGFFAQVCFSYGFQRTRAGIGSVVRTIDVPLAFLLGLVFLHEVPHMASVIGSMLVVLGVVLIGAKELRRK